MASSYTRLQLRDFQTSTAVEVMHVYVTVDSMMTYLLATIDA